MTTVPFWRNCTLYSTQVHHLPLTIRFRTHVYVVRQLLLASTFIPRYLPLRLKKALGQTAFYSFLLFFHRYSKYPVSLALSILFLPIPKTPTYTTFIDIAIGISVYSPDIFKFTLSLLYTTTLRKEQLIRPRNSRPRCNINICKNNNPRNTNYHSVAIYTHNYLLYKGQHELPGTLIGRSGFVDQL